MKNTMFLPPPAIAPMLLGVLTRLGSLAAVIVVLSGCAGEPSAVRRNPVSAHEQLQNAYRPPLQGALTRVAVLPLAGDVQPNDALREMNDTFLSEFNKSQVFEGVGVNTEEYQAMLHRPPLLSTDAIPPDLLPELRRRYGAEAVLFTDITQYRPYRPISIGVRTKMISLASGEVLWSVDAVFDSSEPAIAATARDYGRSTVQNPVSSKPVDNAGTLMSPRRYVRFVARELYTRLPGRLVPKPSSR